MKEEITQKEIAIIGNRIGDMLAKKRLQRLNDAKALEKKDPSGFRVTVFKYSVKDLLTDIGYDKPHQAQSYLDHLFNRRITNKTERYYELVKRLGI